MATLFDEILFDSTILTARSAVGSPEFANTIIRNPATGIFKVNVVRYDFQHVWNINTKLLNPDALEYFNNFWGGGFGSAYGFRMRIISDFYAVNEVIGVGNGVQTVFNIIKTYIRPGANHSYLKRIVKPVVNALTGGSSVTLYEADGVTSRVIPSELAGNLSIPAFRVMKDGVVQSSGYTVDNTTGKITFAAAPANGVVVSWSGEFDLPVRFLNNSFQQTPDVDSEVGGLQIVEILPAELNIT